jgi:hypothetical protein
MFASLKVVGPGLAANCIPPFGMFAVNGVRVRVSPGVLPYISNVFTGAFGSIP